MPPPMIVEAFEGFVTAMECDCCDEVTVGLAFRLDSGLVLMVNIPSELAEAIAASVPDAIANRMPAIDGGLGIPMPESWR